MEAIVAQLASESEELHQVPEGGVGGLGESLAGCPPRPEAPNDGAPAPTGDGRSLPSGAHHGWG